MDDLRATLGTFDPDAPLPGAPDPWDYLPMPSLRDGPPWAMAEMIAAEPGLVDRIGRRVLEDGSARALADAVLAAKGAPVVVTGCGTSEHAAMGVAAILGDALRAAGQAAGWPRAAQAFELALEPAAGGLVIGISHEGGTAATIGAMAARRSGGARVAAITASAGSPAAQTADVVLATGEMDGSWCHTVGYVSPLSAAAAAAALIEGTSRPEGALGRRVRAGIEAAWAGDGSGGRPASQLGRAIAEAHHLLVVASGADRISARELVLKVEEAAWVPSAMRDLETFLHGHLPATGADTTLALILTDPRALETRAMRARQALSAAQATGIRCGAILSAAAAALVPGSLTNAGRIVVPDGDGLPPSIGALLGAAAPLQLVTLEVAAARGTNPDPIRRDDPVYLRAAELADDPSI